MKRLRLIAVILIVPVLCLALLIEVVNPHSFLGGTGAFLRATALTAAAAVWVRLSWRKRDWIFKVGLTTVTVAALLYWQYGFQELCYANMDLLETHERSDGVSFFGDCTTVFSRMTSNGAADDY